MNKQTIYSAVIKNRIKGAATCGTIFVSQNIKLIDCTIRYGYDTRCYFTVRSKGDIRQLNLPHETKN